MPLENVSLRRKVPPLPLGKAPLWRRCPSLWQNVRPGARPQRDSPELCASGERTGRNSGELRYLRVRLLAVEPWSRGAVEPWSRGAVEFIGIPYRNAFKENG